MALGNYRGSSFFKAFVRYVFALYERDMKELHYRIYVTDMLRNIPQMTYLTDRWIDTVKSNRKADNRTADEIVDDLIASLSGGNS